MSTIGTRQVGLEKELPHAKKEKQNFKIILIQHQNDCTVSHWRPIYYLGSGSDQEQLGKHLKPDVCKAAVATAFLFPGTCSIDRLPDPGIRVGWVSMLLSNNFESNFANLLNKINFELSRIQMFILPCFLNPR